MDEAFSFEGASQDYLVNRCSKNPIMPTEGEPVHARLNSILPRPLASRSLVTGPICFVDVRNLRNQRVIRVGVRQHGADGQQN